MTFLLIEFFVFLYLLHMLRPVNISNFNSTHFVLLSGRMKINNRSAFFFFFFGLVCEQAAGVLRNQWPDEAMFDLFVTT